MTKQQAEWAKQHDWHYQSAKTLNGNWIVYARPDTNDVPDLTLQDGTPLMQFAMYDELRAWAGY